MFASGLSVEELLVRERAGWAFRKTKVSEKFTFEQVKATLPEDSDVLLLVRKDGTLLFFTHASRPTGAPGDTVISYGLPAPKAEAGAEAKAAGAAKPLAAGGLA